MVIYNGVHYDALAVSPSPCAPHEDDVTEFNPRTKRGKLIQAAAHQLVCVHAERTQLRPWAWGRQHGATAAHQPDLTSHA
jgi:hypothetical protein